MTDTDDVNRMGVSLAGLLVTRHIGIFREQSTSDYGVDGHVEFKDGPDLATGRLVGVQLKSGTSAFCEPYDDGWIFRPTARHTQYWLGHSLPAYVLLADIDNDQIYWQEFSERTLQTGPRGGTYVEVPRTQTLANARGHWRAAADEFARLAGPDYDENLTHLSPGTAKEISKFAQDHPVEAQLLTAHLARGRATPNTIVRALLDSKPAWLLAGDKGEGLGALAQYAQSHELPALSVEVLEAVISFNPEQRYRYTRNSGLLLLDHDRDKARALLDEARAMPDSAGDLQLDLGLAAAAHPRTSADPIAISDELHSRLEAAANEVVAVSFLGRQAELGGDFDVAVRRHEAALALDTDQTVYMHRLAHALLRRSVTARAHPSDATRAVEYASTAMNQLRAWSGPTCDVLDTLLQSQLAAGRFGAALNDALTPPRGRATPAESERPHVQSVAALAARSLGRLDIVDAVLGSMPEGLDRDLVRLRVVGDSQSDDARDSWLDLVERLDLTRPQELLTGVLRLADFGIDQSDRLDDLVQLGMITSSMRATAAAMAAAVQDLETNLPSLRLLAETEQAAALKLVELLLGAERYDDAENAADAAISRFTNELFTLLRVDALDGQNRTDDAEQALTRALSLPTLDPYNARLVRRRLISIAYQRITAASDTATRTRTLREAEQHAAACVEQPDLATEDRDVWRLAATRYDLGDTTAAWQTIVEHDPAFDHRDNAALWLTLARQQPNLPITAFARMLDLADQFAGDVQLSAHLLTTVTTMTRDAEDEPASPADPRQVLPGELRAAAFESLRAHVARHGDASPVKFVNAPTPEDLVVVMTDLLRRDDAPLIELLEMARQARLPAGMFSSAIGTPYASTLAERPLGYYLTAPAIEEDDDLDVEAAQAAADRDVVIDASALLVATELGEYDPLRSQFRSVLIPTVSAEDVARGRSDLNGRSASSGFVTYNAKADTIVASELDVDEHLETLRRYDRLERAAAAPQRVADVTLDSLEEVNMPEGAAWLAPIALAKERGIALWSDDLGQRRLARAFGVAAFATTTLQYLRATAQLDGADTDEAVAEILEKRKQDTLRHIDKQVVDVPVDTHVVLQAADDADWHERIALVTIGRPGWWHMTTPNPFDELRTILTAAPEADGLRDKWRYHAMWGVVRLAFGEASRGATLLAAVALVPTGDFDPEEAARHVRAAQQIAIHRKAHDPAGSLAEAATLLAEAGVLDDAAQAVALVRVALEP